MLQDGHPAASARIRLTEGRLAELVGRVERRSHVANALEKGSRPQDLAGDAATPLIADALVTRAGRR
jgi:hypothetical protein